MRKTGCKEAYTEAGVPDKEADCAGLLSSVSAAGGREGGAAGERL